MATHNLPAFSNRMAIVKSPACSISLLFAHYWGNNVFKFMVLNQIYSSRKVFDCSLFPPWVIPELFLSNSWVIPPNIPLHSVRQFSYCYLNPRELSFLWDNSLYVDSRHHWFLQVRISIISESTFKVDTEY